MTEHVRLSVSLPVPRTSRPGAWIRLAPRLPTSFTNPVFAKAAELGSDADAGALAGLNVDVDGDVGVNVNVDRDGNGDVHATFDVDTYLALAASPQAAPVFDREHSASSVDRRLDVGGSRRCGRPTRKSAANVAVHANVAVAVAVNVDAHVNVHDHVDVSSPSRSTSARRPSLERA
jgi:hypothetical protein